MEELLLTLLLMCLLAGAVALAIVFASERWRPWMLLLVQSHSSVKLT